MNSTAHLRTLPRLVDHSLGLTHRGGYGEFFKIAVPLAVLTAINSALSVWAMLGIQEGSGDAGCGALMLSAVASLWMMLVMLIGWSSLWVLGAQRVLKDGGSAFAAFVFSLRPSVFLTLVICAVMIVIASVLTFFVAGLGGFLVAACFALTVPVLVAETSSPAALGGAWKRAWYYREGRRRPVLELLAMLLMVFAMMQMLSLLTGMPAQVLIQSRSFEDLMSGGSGQIGAVLWWQVPTQFLAGLVSAWVMYYLGHCLALYYEAGSRRLYGEDLSRQLDRFGVEEKAPEAQW